MRTQTNKRQREQLGAYLMQTAFNGQYRQWVSADDIYLHLHAVVIALKNKLIRVFNKHTVKPLYKLNGSPRDKRHVISFVKRLAQYLLHVVATRKKSCLTDTKVKTIYEHCLVST